MSRRDVEYVLPLRWADETPDRDLEDLATYLRVLSRHADVTVVDGSSPRQRGRLRAAVGPGVRLIQPVGPAGLNGKVASVVTGVRAARHERVVLADDDVRYDAATLAAVAGALDDADLVRPQNVFAPAPWHARWDTGRALLNRALGHDHPGTFGVRRSTFLAMGGYDGDALFENLELARTVRAAGGREMHRPDLYVPRRPPTARHFLGQRVRQAYDDLAQPARLVAELALLPVVARLALGHRRRLVVGLLGVVALAETGRRRAGGSRVYPRSAPLWALPWLAERSVCVWIALAHRARGGVPYRQRRVRRAASSARGLVLHPRTPLEPLRDNAFTAVGEAPTAAQ